jgi:MFS transporter, PPP family, 3-phenylpropionic acid transporter
MHAVPVVRLGAFYFAYFAFVGGFAPYFSLYLQSLGMTAVQIGALLSLMQLMRIFAPNVWAGIADRSGARIVLLRLALAACALAWCGLFFVFSFWGLFAVLCVFAFFSSAAYPLAEALTFAHLRDDLGRYGQLRVWGSIGFIVAVLGVGAILDAQPVQVLTGILLAPLVASLAAGALWREGASETRHGSDQPVLPMLRRPRVAALFAACFLMSVAHGPLYTFYSIYLDQAGYEKSVIGILWALGVLAEIGVFMLMPRLLAWYSPESILVASFACAVVRFAAIGWGVQWPAVLVAAQVLHAATFGAYHAAALGLVNQWFKGGQRVRGQAMYTSLSFGAGGMVGGMASGLAWESFGPAWTFTAGSVCAGLGLILAAATATMGPRPAR